MHRFGCPSFSRVLLAGILLAAVTFAPLTVVAQQEDSGKSGSWQIPGSREIRVEFGEWLKSTNVPEDRATEIQNYLLRQIGSDSSEPCLNAIVRGMVMARPDLTSVVERIEATRERLDPSLLDQIFLISGHTFVDRHLRLFAMETFGRHGLYDEALQVAEGIEAADVVQPHVLLFWRATAYHQLFQKAKCQLTLRRLLEQKDRLPKRFVVLAELMTRDIENLQDESLDEITRMMNDVQRRLSLYRAGKIVLDQEKAVLEKLDKLIERLEEEQKKSQQQSQSQKGPPSKPMEDSRNVGGKGSGDVTNKRLNEGGNWGDLPPAEKAQTLAEMTRDLPPHYRAIVEEYFKKLARQNENDK
ncbi:MAG: hypothetical protein ABL888_15340 [Pirellulaceae bacterium]